MSIDLANPGASAGALKAALASLVQARPANNLIGALGHSMLDQGNGNFGTAPNIDTQFTIGSFPWWANFLSKGRYVIDRQSWLGAVSGSNTQQQANGAQITSAVNSRAATILMWCETNDRPAGFTLDDGTTANLGSAGTVTIPNVKAMINALVGAGKFVVLVADPPRGTAAFSSFRLTGAQLAYHAAYRNWVLNVAPALWPGRVFGIDTWADGENTISGTAGDVRDLFTRDGVHPATPYAPPIAQRVNAVLDGLGVPRRSVPVLGAVDAYDATTNPTGSLVGAARLAGTGSAAASLPATQGGVTYSGARPSGFGVTASSAAQAGTLAVALGRGVVSPQSGGQADWFEMAISGTTVATANPAITMSYALSTAERASLAAGDKITIFDEFEIDAGGVGLRGVDFRMIVTRPSGTETIRTANVDATMGTLDTYLATQGMAGYHDGGGLFANITGAETDITLYWLVQMAESASPNFKARWRKPAVRKVQ